MGAQRRERLWKTSQEEEAFELDFREWTRILQFWWELLSEKSQEDRALGTVRVEGALWGSMIQGPYPSCFVTGMPSYPFTVFFFIVLWIIFINHCNFYLQWCPVPPMRKPSLYCLVPLLVAAPTLCSLLLKTASYVVPLCHLLSKDQTAGHLSDASSDPTETLPHWSQLGTRNRGCFWSFSISP